MPAPVLCISMIAIMLALVTFRICRKQTGGDGADGSGNNMHHHGEGTNP